MKLSISGYMPGQKSRMLLGKQPYVKIITKDNSLIVCTTLQGGFNDIIEFKNCNKIRVSK